MSFDQNERDIIKSETRIIQLNPDFSENANDVDDTDKKDAKVISIDDTPLRKKLLKQILERTPSY